MPSALLSAAQLAVTVALVAWMITGFTRRPGRWFRYPLFSRATFVIIDLTGTKDGQSEPVNPYAFLSPGTFLLPPPQLQTVIDHLIRTGRYDRIDGQGRCLSVKGEQPIEVRDSHVVL
ncbi:MULTISPECIES: hypothetical protein [unclassified Streptomyces]|uniref:hypothetical protein n=1 Tax=unclassified Streptomyces TaxID=2593676 RepID=UPI002365C4D1|nr:MULTISPECIES: hypothetical protein [unclassified Streptomyces]MDF3144169.1 hypothetical protein [Streptomyces sp. T21Q-yed]WDF45077.1 hypothetical protein PBV52_51165 [Streptomyces sp. T12]